MYVKQSLKEGLGRKEPEVVHRCDVTQPGVRELAFSIVFAVVCSVVLFLAYGLEALKLSLGSAKVKPWP